MNRIYCAIGKIVELAQNIEDDASEICFNSEIIKEFSRNKQMTMSDYKQVESDASYLKEKMRTMTFGAMINVVYESKSLNYDEIKQLKTLLEKRNYFVHEYFKNTKFGISPKEEFILEEFSAIKEYIASLKKMLTRLEIVLAGQKERLNYLMVKIK